MDDYWAVGFCHLQFGGRKKANSTDRELLSIPTISGYSYSQCTGGVEPAMWTGSPDTASKKPKKQKLAVAPGKKNKFHLHPVADGFPQSHEQEQSTFAAHNSTHNLSQSQAKVACQWHTHTPSKGIRQYRPYPQLTYIDDCRDPFPSNHHRRILLHIEDGCCLFSLNHLHRGPMHTLCT